MLIPTDRLSDPVIGYSDGAADTACAMIEA
jgi:hypothetical protein